MKMLGRRRIGLGVLMITGIWGGATSPGQTAPGDAPAAASTAPATTPAKMPTVDELLAGKKPAPFDFTNAPVSQIISHIAKSYDIDIVNEYKFTDLLTMKQLGNLTAREAINILNTSIMALGYTVSESVRGDPPRVKLTIVPTRVDAGTLTPFFYGNDPASIPEGEARRTQVLTFTAVDPDKARAMIVSVVGAQADITVNPSTKTITITDTATHVHTAAALLQVLEKQAAEKK